MIFLINSPAKDFHWKRESTWFSKIKDEVNPKLAKKIIK